MRYFLISWCYEMTIRKITEGGGRMWFSGRDKKHILLSSASNLSTFIILYTQSKVIEPLRTATWSKKDDRKGLLIWDDCKYDVFLTILTKVQWVSVEKHLTCYSIRNAAHGPIPLYKQPNWPVLHCWPSFNLNKTHSTVTLYLTAGYCTWMALNHSHFSSFFPPSQSEENNIFRAQ